MAERTLQTAEVPSASVAVASSPQEPARKFARAEFEASLVAAALSDEAFRRRLIAEPTATYAAALGHPIPDGVEVRVVTEGPSVFYLVLPFLPGDREVDEETRLGVARHVLTHREPCWGLGDGLD
jgi:hypothetical protein